MKIKFQELRVRQCVHTIQLTLTSTQESNISSFKEKYYFKGLIFAKFEEIYLMKYTLCNKLGCLGVSYAWLLCSLRKVRGDHVTRKCRKGVSVG